MRACEACRETHTGYAEGCACPCHVRKKAKPPALPPEITHIYCDKCRGMETLANWSAHKCNPPVPACEKCGHERCERVKAEAELATARCLIDTMASERDTLYADLNAEVERLKAELHECREAKEAMVAAMYEDDKEIERLEDALRVEAQFSPSAREALGRETK